MHNALSYTRFGGDDVNGAHRYYCTLENRVRFRIEQPVSEINGYNIPVGCQMDILWYTFITIMVYYVWRMRLKYTPRIHYIHRTIHTMYILDRLQDFRNRF